MMRVLALDAAPQFSCGLPGLKQVRRSDHEQGRSSLVFVATRNDDDTAEIELTWNGDQTEPCGGGRSLVCERLQAGAGGRGGSEGGVARLRFVVGMRVFDPT